MGRTRAFRSRILCAGAVVLLPLLAGCGERMVGPVAPDEDPIGTRKPEKPDQLDGEIPVPPSPTTPPTAVPYRLVAEISAGWTAEDIAARWGTTTLDELPDSPFALLKMPYDVDYEALAAELIGYGACVTCEQNFYVQSPESEQGSIPFYEGDLETSDYQDQEAFARVHAGAANQIVTGAGTTVAILDTGIDSSHPDLAGVTRSDGWDFIEGDSDPTDLAEGIDDDEDGTVDEAAGHGTHVAGIVRAVASGTELLPVRVLNSDGVGTVYWVARGIGYAADAGANVINLSLGFNGYSRVVDWAVQRANEAGVVLVASAGNEGRYDTSHFPANLPDVLSVAAVTADDFKAPFSNFGPRVGISAPGVGIVSTYLFQGYATWSGTSMAAPFVSGAASLARENWPGANAGTIRKFVKEAAVHPDHSGQTYEDLMGAGRVDLLPIALDAN